MGPRSAGLAALALLSTLTVGCKGDRQASDKNGDGDSPRAEAEAAPELPTDEAAFLALLAPLPGGAEAIEIHYRVEGPDVDGRPADAALAGEMSVALGPGGVRRDRWELRSNAGDAYLRAAGSRIVTPDQIWTAPAGQPGTIVDHHLGGLARAYLERGAEDQAKIVAGIETWRRTLAEQRERAAGERDEILGVSCLRTRLAGQNVCMWEETGALLEYQGSAFEIEAERIDRAPQLPDDTFVLPPISSQAERETRDAPDYDAILDDIIAGSYAKLSTLIYASATLPIAPPSQ